MDLIAIVAACALTVDPKLMHALIWHQSGGEPWSFSVAGERQPQVYRSAREAVIEAHRSALTGPPIRMGLTGLGVDSAAATLAMLMPCPNISIAARQITQLSDDAPNFDMPDDVGDRSDDAATELSVGGQRFSAARGPAPDDQQQAWSSALFPQGRSSSTARVQAVRMQIGCKSPAG
jgi:hypothetical protein